MNFYYANIISTDFNTERYKQTLINYYSFISPLSYKILLALGW